MPMMQAIATAASIAVSVAIEDDSAGIAVCSDDVNSDIAGSGVAVSGSIGCAGDRISVTPIAVSANDGP